MAGPEAERQFHRVMVTYDDLIRVKDRGRYLDEAQPTVVSGEVPKGLPDLKTTGRR